MTELSSSIVHDVLGSRIEDVDQPIVDYIVNVLADEDFDFGEDGDGAFEAVGELLVGAECVSDFDECRMVSSSLRAVFMQDLSADTRSGLVFMCLFVASQC